MYIPIRTHSMPFRHGVGLGFIHIGVGFCNTHSLVKELVPPRCANGSNGTDTHPFCINPAA